MIGKVLFFWKGFLSIKIVSDDLSNFGIHHVTKITKTTTFSLKHGLNFNFLLIGGLAKFGDMYIFSPSINFIAVKFIQILIQDNLVEVSRLAETLFQPLVLRIRQTSSRDEIFSKFLLPSNYSSSVEYEALKGFLPKLGRLSDHCLELKTKETTENTEFEEF